MKKSRPYLFAFVALLLGWVGGSTYSSRFYDHSIERFQLHAAHGDASARLATLQALRSGETNQAAELLEGQLDAQVILLGTLLAAQPVAQRPATEFQLLTQIRDYRRTHPRQSAQPATDQTVAGFLNWTNALAALPGK